MKLPSIHSLFHARTPAAQLEMVRFMERYKSYAENIQSIALTILVWGPSIDKNDAIAQKRMDIYKALLDVGHNAILSENLPAINTDLSLKTLEYAQAKAAHLIIILIEDAQGALGELHDFGGHPDIVGKFFVLVPIRYRDSYSAAGTLYNLEKGYGAVHWYEEDEIVSCRVQTEALLRAQARREIYAEYVNSGGMNL